MNLFSILLAIVAACIPAIVWFAFFSKEDSHPEPKRLIVYTFSAGVFVSIIVLALQFIFQSIISQDANNLLLSIVTLALIEELFKFFAASWAVRRDIAFDEPVDAMVYMIAAALGFATVENIFVLIGSLSSITTSPFISTVETMGLRFIGATLLHVLASAIVGYYWAKGRMRKKESIYVIVGILVATFIHAFFNHLILAFQDKNLLVYPSIFLIVIAFFVVIEFEKLRNAKKASIEK